MNHTELVAHVMSNRTSVLLDEARDKMVEVRRLLDMTGLERHCKDRVQHVSGALTCGISSLYDSVDQERKGEILQDDRKFGPSEKFAPRGIGSEHATDCFICSQAHLDDKNRYAALHNIAAFAASKESGEKIVGWFGETGGAWVDYREHEPTWIQVKVCACARHLPQLQWLYNRTCEYAVIREDDVRSARKFLPKEENVPDRT